MAPGQCCLIHDIGVGPDQVVATPPGLAGDAGGDDDELAPCGGAVVVRPHDAGVESLDRRGLPLVEALPLGHALDHVHEDDGAGELFFGEALGGGGADVAGSHHGDLVEHGA